MTSPSNPQKELTSAEWKELVDLKDAISYDPHTVSPENMEKFTELFVRSLDGKGDSLRQ